jgi:hypothetical protein
MNISIVVASAPLVANGSFRSANFRNSLLEVHRRQAATNRRLIAQADAKGQFRLAENLRHVQANLERIIPALEAVDEEQGPEDGA